MSSNRSRLAKLEAIAESIGLEYSCAFCRRDRPGQAVLLTCSPDGQVLRIKPDTDGRLLRANGSVRHGIETLQGC